MNITLSFESIVWFLLVCVFLSLLSQVSICTTIDLCPLLLLALGLKGILERGELEELGVLVIQVIEVLVQDLAQELNNLGWLDHLRS